MMMVCMLTTQLTTGQQLLQEVALRYATQHGLRPETIEWVAMGGDEWWLKVATAERMVKVVFSADELVDFAESGAGSSGTKAKIRNAFASLSM